MSPEGRIEKRAKLEDPVIDRVKKALVGIEPTEENVRRVINETHEELTDEIPMAASDEERKELRRQADLLVNRGEDIIKDLVPSAEMLDE